MNKPLLTRAAEGLDRWGWTNAQVRALIDTGVMDADEPMELIKGEIVPMAAEFNDHVKMRLRLQRHFQRGVDALKISPDLLVATEVSLFLFKDTEFRPDVCIFPEAIRTEEVRGPDVLLAIEVASSSHRLDLGVKPPIYGQSGLRELWVVDLDTSETVVHRAPAAGGYADVKAVPFSASLEGLALPNIPVRVADFL